MLGRSQRQWQKEKKQKHSTRREKKKNARRRKRWIAETEGEKDRGSQAGGKIRSANKVGKNKMEEGWVKHTKQHCTQVRDYPGSNHWILNVTASSLADVHRCFSLGRFKCGNGSVNENAGASTGGIPCCGAGSSCGIGSCCGFCCGYESERGRSWGCDCHPSSHECRPSLPKHKRVC